MKRSLKLAGLAAMAAGVGSLLVTTAQAAIPAVGATFYVSGASAARKIPPAVAADLCDAGVNDLAAYEYGPKPKDYTIQICTFKNAAPVPTSLRGVKVAVFTRAAGGSLFGVRGVAVPQAIQFIDGSSCPADDGNAATTQQCPNLTADADYAVPNGVGDGHVPDAGISDEDPQFVCAVAAENGPVQCTAAELAGIKNTAKFKSFATYQIIWEIMAGATFGGAANPVNNISTSVLKGIFTGSITSVGQVQKLMGLPAPYSTQGLKVCRRTNTSGTQAGHAQLWTGSIECGDNDGQFVDETYDDNNAGNGFPANYDVVEANSSGDVEACLTTPAADQDRAIGINSFENSGIAGTKDLSIDGQAPSLEAAAKGSYPWYAESTIQWNTDVLNNVAALNDFVNADLTARATNTQRNQFATLFRDFLRNPSLIVSAGINGVNAIPNFAAPTDPYSAANPVGWTSKLVTLGGSNCQRVPAPFFPAP